MKEKIKNFFEYGLYYFYFTIAYIVIFFTDRLGFKEISKKLFRINRRKVSRKFRVVKIKIIKILKIP